MNNNQIIKLYQRFYSGRNDTLNSLTPLRGHGINSKNFLLSCKKEKYVLKVIKDYDEQTFKKLDIIEGCFRSGIKVPLILRNKNGELYSKSADGDVAVLIKYYSGTQTVFSKDQLISAGRELARLNLKLSESEEDIKRSRLYSDLNEDEVIQIKNMLDLVNPFDSKAGSLMDKLKDHYEEFRQQTAGYHTQDQIVHMDYLPDNVMFEGDQVLVILDFDSLVTAPRILSAAFACDRFCRSEDEMKYFLQGYSAEDDILQENVLELIPYFIKREALNRINFILRSSFFNNNNVWDFELDKHLSIINKEIILEHKKVLQDGSE
ncbi:phosphotransferase [Elusimicrobiota bacterium]